MAHFKNIHSSLSLSRSLVAISILYCESSDCSLVKIVLSGKKFVCDFSLFAYGIWYMANANMRRDSRFMPYLILFYFILFTAFIHLFTLHSLKGADKRVPSPSPSPWAVTPPLRWASVGQGRFYCPSILFYSISLSPSLSAPCQPQPCSQFDIKFRNLFLMAF